MHSTKKCDVCGMFLGRGDGPKAGTSGAKLSEAARAYNGSGSGPPAGSMGRAPGGGSGAKPPEAESFSVFARSKDR